MELTTAMLRPFAGGHIEVQNQDPGDTYLYHGAIKSAEVQGVGERATLIVELDWQAKGEDFPPFPGRWVKAEVDSYEASLVIYSVSEIGNGRIALQSKIGGELAVLFPKGVGNKLDRSKVKGL